MLWAVLVHSFCSKFTGQFHLVVKGVVGTIEHLTSWQQSGRQEHASGEHEINAANADNRSEGITGDRYVGKEDAAVGNSTANLGRELAGAGERLSYRPVLSFRPCFSLSSRGWCVLCTAGVFVRASLVGLYGTPAMTRPRPKRYIFTEYER